MKLLTSVLSTTWSVRLSAQFVFTAFVVAAVLGLEMAGRWLVCDLQDLVAVIALSGIVGSVVAWHRRRPLAWVNWLLARGNLFIKRLSHWKYEHGIDFRGFPSYPRRLPAFVWWTIFTLIAWASLSLYVWNAYPGGWRDIGTSSSYVVYLVAMSCIWTLLAVCLLAGLFVPVEMLNRQLRTALSEQDRRGVMFIASLTYLLAVVGAATFLPVVYILAVCGLALLAATTSYLQPTRAEISILWRSTRGRAVYSIPLHRLLSGGVFLTVLLFVCLILTASGGRLLTLADNTDRMRITGLLGALTAWTAPGLLCLLAIRAWYGRLSDPSRHSHPSVRVTGAVAPEQRAAATDILREWQWTVRPESGPAQKGQGDVKIEIVPADKSEATEFNPPWPLKVSVNDLQRDVVRERLTRRDELQVRRRFYRGLTHLFRRAISDRRRRGGGYWFAPHWWFIDSLAREDGGRKKRTEDGSGPIRQSGPTYEEAFGRRVRQYLHRVLRAVQIDVIYIEDGVKMRSVVRVFRDLFEVYDIHDGKRIVDDHTFLGIPGVRVTIHELSPDKPFEAASYKQPRFDDLSRGRVLHIFRDRSDHEEVEDVPFEFSWEPAPVVFGR